MIVASGSPATFLPRRTSASSTSWGSGAGDAARACGAGALVPTLELHHGALGAWLLFYSAGRQHWLARCGCGTRGPAQEVPGARRPVVFSVMPPAGFLALVGAAFLGEGFGQVYVAAFALALAGPSAGDLGRRAEVHPEARASLPWTARSVSIGGTSLSRTSSAYSPTASARWQVDAARRLSTSSATSIACGVAGRRPPGRGNIRQRCVSREGAATAAVDSASVPNRW